MYPVRPDVGRRVLGQKLEVELSRIAPTEGEIGKQQRVELERPVIAFGREVFAYVLRIDFGALGTRTSSAQITRNYAPGDLVGKQVVAVLNFEPKRVAGVKSEVLVLGAVSAEHGVVLLEPTFAVESGTRIG